MNWKEYFFYIQDETKAPKAPKGAPTEKHLAPTKYTYLLIAAVALAIVLVLLGPVGLASDILNFSVALIALIIGYTTIKYSEYEPKYLNYLIALILIIFAIVFNIIPIEFNYSILIIIAAEIAGITIKQK